MPRYATAAHDARPAMFEPLESRQLFAIPATLAITSVTTTTPTVATNKPFTAKVTVANTATEPAAISADLFLVPQGKTLDAKTNAVTLFGLKPITAGTSRSLSQSRTISSITPGVYTLTACLIDPATGLPDTAKAVTGPTITFVTPPTAKSLSASLALPKTPTTLATGTKISPVITLTNTTAATLATKVPVSFYLSSDQTFSSKDILVASQKFDVSLATNKATTFTRTFAMPAGKPKGKFYLIAVANPNNSNPALWPKVAAASNSRLTVK